jgi:ribonuclease BN (tRNA processing enzyme)
VHIGALSLLSWHRMKTSQNGLRITVLGSGDAFGSGGRLQSSYLVEGEQTTLLLDCGATVLPALKGRGIDTGRIDFILISHLHGDHFGGLPFLLLEYLYENPRSRPLVIAGPAGLGDRTRTVYAGLYGEAAATELPFPLEFRELKPGRAETIHDVEVEPFRVPHQTSLVSFGFRLAIEGRSILYSGDSAWSEVFIRQSRGTDLFLCECFLFDTEVTYHMNYRELIRHVPRLGCKRLVAVSLECVNDGTVLII